MKCIYCGEELDEKDRFCPKCKKAAQIVPDYSLYEDDYLKQVLAEENQPGRIKKKTEETANKPKNNNSKDAMQRAMQQKKMQKKILGSVVVVAVVFVLALLVLAAAIRSNHANSVSYQLSQAQKAYTKGNMEEALSYYERALELDPNNNEIRLALAKLYMEQKRDTDAEKLYKEVLRTDKANREACKNLIKIYDNRDDLDAILSLKERVDESLSQLFEDYTVLPPEFGLEPGTYETAQTLMLTSTKDYQIYYTLDGSDPVTNGILYSSPLVLDENGKTYLIKAVCMNRKKIYGVVKARSYTIRFPVPDMPIVTPDGGDFGIRTTVSITVPDGCSAYYTWDGSTPNIYSSRYTQPLLIPEGNHILTVVIIDNSTNLKSELYKGRFVYYETSSEDEAETPEAEEN